MVDFPLPFPRWWVPAGHFSQLQMDHELTGKAFKQFMGRRGLGRSQESSEDAEEDPAAAARLMAQPSARRATSQQEELPSGSQSAQPRERLPGIAQIQGSSSTSQEKRSSRESSAGEAEEGTKKQYFCEHCHLPFGRKHHKERHVANIHRQVRSQHG